MVKKMDKKYQKDIKKEATHWDSAAKKDLKKNPPDYRYYKNTLPYKIYRHKYVMEMLSNVNTGDKVLELGCFNGWFTLEMARKGAIIDAHDLSPYAIKIAKEYYSQCKKRGLKGKIKYYITDLNNPTFEEKNYDVIVIRNVLHHLINIDSLYNKLKIVLKDNGKVLVDDALPCGKVEALFTGILLFILPTDIPYNKKFQRVFKNRHILKRTQGLVDACNSTPFEGATGKESIIYLNNYFKKIRYKTFASFIGAITSHLKISVSLSLFLLKILNFFDQLLINLRVLKGTGYYLALTK